MIDLSKLTTTKELNHLTIDYPDGLSVESIISAIEYRIISDIPPRHIYQSNIRVKDGDSNSRYVSDSFDAYLSDPSLQSGHLKAAYKTAFHYAYSKSDDKRLLESLRETPPAFSIGTYLHQCLLEPTKFKRAVVMPKFANDTEGVTEKYRWVINTISDLIDKDVYPIETREKIGVLVDSMPESNTPRIRLKINELIKVAQIDCLTQEQYEKVKILSLHADNYAGGTIHRLLRHARREISFYTKDFDTIPLKVRPDAIAFKENIGVNAVISIKSTSAADIRSFASQCASYHYDLTEALYQDVLSHVTGRDFRTTISIMLQTVEPYTIALLVWSPDDIQRGRQKYRHAITTIQLADSIGSYPGFESYAGNDLGLIPFEMPVWNNLEEMPN